MKKIINIYDLESIKNLKKEEVFFLINALKIHPITRALKSKTIKYNHYNETQLKKKLWIKSII
jgi:hypothetical protein